MRKISSDEYDSITALLVDHNFKFKKSRGLKDDSILMLMAYNGVDSLLFTVRVLLWDTYIIKEIKVHSTKPVVSQGDFYDIKSLKTWIEGR